MGELTGVARIGNILTGQPVDRIGLFEHFWGDTLEKWREQGHIAEGEDLATHFGFDLDTCWPLKMVARLDFEPQVLEETDETILTRDGNGAVLRRHKLHSSTPEHVDFAVKERRAWEELVKPFLAPSRERIDFEAYRRAREEARRQDRFFCWSGINVFELMHPMCGHEFMLIGMADDPDWVRDMAATYADLTIALMETLFAEEGRPDGIWFYEDMGFRGRPFMSPTMYREIIQFAHRKTFDYAHSLGLRVIVHSCGFIEPLLPHMVEAGLDCLQVIEVKAGMDPLRIKETFGDRLALCGGMDARNLVANDLEAIGAELREKLPVLKEGHRYILHSDHSIPTTTDYETYRFFVDEGLPLGTY